ncbi:MAG: TetR/AcrR family transcriptional regulator [Bulleidia sp.]
MEKQLDLRIQRTYKLLCDAFISLLCKKDFESIQVKEICEKAMVRRATFYKHFADKYELFTYVIKQIQADFQVNNIRSYDASNPQDYFLVMTEQTFRFLENNKQMVSNIISSSASAILLDLLAEQIELDVRQHLSQDRKNGIRDSIDPEIFASMFTGALIHTAKQWVLNSWSPDKAAIINEFMKTGTLLFREDHSVQK